MEWFLYDNGLRHERVNVKISVLVYKKPTHTKQYLQYKSHHETSCKVSLISSCLIEHIPLQKSH